MGRITNMTKLEKHTQTGILCVFIFIVWLNLLCILWKYQLYSSSMPNQNIHALPKINNVELRYDLHTELINLRFY